MRKRFLRTISGAALLLLASCAKPHPFRVDARRSQLSAAFAGLERHALSRGTESFHDGRPRLGGPASANGSARRERLLSGRSAQARSGRIPGDRSRSLSRRAEGWATTRRSTTAATTSSQPAACSTTRLSNAVELSLSPLLQRRNIPRRRHARLRSPGREVREGTGRFRKPPARRSRCGLPQPRRRTAQSSRQPPRYPWRWRSSSTACRAPFYGAAS